MFVELNRLLFPGTGMSDWTSYVIRFADNGSTAATVGTGLYRERVSIQPLANGDALLFTNFEGGQRMFLSLLDPDGRGQGGITYTSTSTSFVVGPVRRYLYVDGTDLTRWLIGDTTLTLDSGFTYASPSGVKAAVQPDGRLLVVTPPTIWDGSHSPAIVRLDTRPVYLANLSGRARTGDGENVAIAGLVVDHSGTASDLSTPILFRGVGPSLHDLGVNDPLPAAVIEFFDTNGDQFAANTRWDASLASTMRAVGAFSLTPNSADAGLAVNLLATRATMILHPVGATAHGVGLLEIYRVPSATPTAQLVNLSFRAYSASGDDTVIAGFVLVDSENSGRTARVLLRAVGPTLSDQGIAHPLANPILTSMTPPANSSPKTMTGPSPAPRSPPRRPTSPPPPNKLAPSISRPTVTTPPSSTISPPAPTPCTPPAAPASSSSRSTSSAERLRAAPITPALIRGFGA